MITISPISIPRPRVDGSPDAVAVVAGRLTSEGFPDPFRAVGLMQRLAPFAAASLALVIVTVIDGRRSTALMQLALLAASFGSIALVRALPSRGLLDRLPPLVGITLVAISQWVDPSPHADTVYLLWTLVPLTWMALYHPTGDLVVGLMMVFAFAFTPAPGDRIDLLVELLALAVWPAVIWTLHRVVQINRSTVTELGHLAGTDPLTSVSNRRRWAEEFERELSRARRNGSPLSIAMLDLDFFKAFNDNNGHAAGDDLLVGAAQAWAGILRPTDLLARRGGEEFGVILPGCDLEGARVIAERLREAVPGAQTCSIGVAVWDRTEPASDLEGRADEALYLAKENGRDLVVVLGD